MPKKDIYELNKSEGQYVKFEIEVKNVRKEVLLKCFSKYRKIKNIEFINSTVDGLRFEIDYERPIAVIELKMMLWHDFEYNSTIEVGVYSK